MTFYDSSAQDLQNAFAKLDFQMRSLNQPKPTHHWGPPSLGRAGELLRRFRGRPHRDPIPRARGRASPSGARESFFADFAGGLKEAPSLGRAGELAGRQGNKGH